MIKRKRMAEMSRMKMSLGNAGGGRSSGSCAPATSPDADS
jgi:hypothetical protein